MNKVFLLLLIATILINACHKKNLYPVVTTFAGSGTMGSINGEGTASSVKLSII